jgi:hypothetical protein
MKKAESQLKSRDLRIDSKNEKYIEEYEKIFASVNIAEKGELFPQLVKLMKLCKKLEISFPIKYQQYYLQTKENLCTEYRRLERRIIVSQINNENYKHYEEKMLRISRILGLST